MSASFVSSQTVTSCLLLIAQHGNGLLHVVIGIIQVPGRLNSGNVIGAIRVLST
jgi:hypothetical protein